MKKFTVYLDDDVIGASKKVEVVGEVVIATGDWVTVQDRTTDAAFATVALFPKTHVIAITSEDA